MVNNRTPLIAGNWKMNMKISSSIKLVEEIAEGIKGVQGLDVLVAPPFTALSAVREAIGEKSILLGAQNMYYEMHGAYTGEISGGMLRDAGCTHVILGHSERRTLFQESNEMVRLKVEAAVSLELAPIICIGESLEQRDSGKTFDVIEKQISICLNRFVSEGTVPLSAILAYEPIWAIGTGRSATPEQAQEVHAFIRTWIEKNLSPETASNIRILYGGSVKPANISGLMEKPDIDGALVGGASLKAGSFVELIRLVGHGRT